MSAAYFFSQTETTIPIYIGRPDSLGLMREILPTALQIAASGREFNGEAGELVVLYTAEGTVSGVLFGAGDYASEEVGPMLAGTLAKRLPQGQYMIAVRPTEWDWAQTAIAWGLGAYKFNRYLKAEHIAPQLLLIDLMQPEETQSLVSAINNGRDLINTPASDMGPQQLHDETVKIAQAHDAQITATVGEDLITDNYPMIHAVGRAGHQPPRLVEFVWGDPSHPRLALVGKGITFDTGGVNIKSAAGARIMKKDMGGAAHALSLADMIMANNLPVHLHVLIAIAENAISANAFRPGDIIASRAGLTVEIDNTDAEGRLVLGDALCKASEDGADHIIDFATLTGAARVALGPTLPPFFSNRGHLIRPVLDQAIAQNDPVWSMPLWRPYIKYLSSPIADMKNSGGSFGGAITAGLFLERFVNNTPWMHFDVYGWNPTSTSFGHAGGEIFALRTLYNWVKEGGITFNQEI